MPWRYYPSDRQFFPLGRSGERGWTSLATCWLHSSVPDGKAQVLWGVKWSVKERNGIPKEAALTLKSSKSVMHCVGPAPKAQEISATPLISSLVVWLLISCDWVWSPSSPERWLGLAPDSAGPWGRVWYTLSCKTEGPSTLGEHPRGDLASWVSTRCGI